MYSIRKIYILLKFHIESVCVVWNWILEYKKKGRWWKIRMTFYCRIHKILMMLFLYQRIWFFIMPTIFLSQTHMDMCISIEPLPHRQDTTQSLFLSGVQFIWNQSFLSRKIAIPKLKSPTLCMCERDLV